jgi:superfamily II DNA or RNA helicase
MSYLGKKGYSIYKKGLSSNSDIDTIKQKLTVKPFSYNNDAKPFPIYLESPNKLYLPRYYGIKNNGAPSEIKLSIPTKTNMKFAKSLKPKQEPIVDAFIKSLNPDYGGGIISVPCGYGKTVIALYIAAQLNLKTLVVVHKEFLVNQWKERIEEFIPGAEVGRIQSKIIKTQNKDIVLGMLQSISMIDYQDDLFNDFGLVIYDECHHLGAEVFSKALLKTNCKYTLGLSATPNRNDGLSRVFEWYLGPIVYRIKKRDDNNVDVKLIDFVDNSQEYSKEIRNYNKKLNCAAMINNICGYGRRTRNYNKKLNYAAMINNICGYGPRIQIIIENIDQCISQGRKILVLSDRREHLKSIKQIIDSKEKYTCGFYLGGMKPAELEKTEKMDVILGTFAMASEGFDCREPLDTIILASPKSNIEQAVGRILRQEEKDRINIPLIIDIIDCFSMFSKQGEKRIKFYKKNKYNISLYNMENMKINNHYIKGKKKACDMEFLEDD